MPTPNQSAYARLMLSALSHAAPGQRIYTGANAGERVCDGDILSQKSTYPKWYSDLCYYGETADAIRRNLRLIADGKENVRGGVLTQGYKRVMKQVEKVMLEGDEASLIWPDPDTVEAHGDPESAQSIRDFIAACNEQRASEELAAEVSAEALREVEMPDIPDKVRAAIPMLAPYASAIEVRGWFTWVIPTDKEAEQALLRAGYSRAVKFGGVYGPPEHARKLPARPCHVMPVVSYQSYH